MDPPDWIGQSGTAPRHVGVAAPKLRQSQEVRDGGKRQCVRVSLGVFTPRVLTTPGATVNIRPARLAQLPSPAPALRGQRITGRWRAARRVMKARGQGGSLSTPLPYPDWSESRIWPPTMPQREPCSPSLDTSPSTTAKRGYAATASGQGGSTPASTNRFSLRWA